VLEITPYEYVHSAKSRRQEKSIAITSPLKWIVNFSGFSVDRLKEGLAHGDPTEFHAQEFVLNFLILHVGLSQKGVPQLFEALRFPVSTQYDPELGKLPVTVFSAAISTVRPPDDTLVESAEVSGKDAFEEVVDLDALLALQDPMRDRLVNLVKAESPQLIR
jgi:hypothetical protein